MMGFSSSVCGMRAIFSARTAMLGICSEVTTKSVQSQPIANRREEARFPAKGVIRYLPTRAAKSWRFLTAQLLDCSAHGIGIECDEPMAPGDDFIVKLHLGKLRLAVYRVQHIAPA